MELETGCSWQASRFVCRAVCCTTPVYKLGHTRELHGKKRIRVQPTIYIYIYIQYIHHCSLTRSNIRLKNFTLSIFIPPRTVYLPDVVLLLCLRLVSCSKEASRHAAVSWWWFFEVGEEGRGREKGRWRAYFSRRRSMCRETTRLRLRRLGFAADIPRKLSSGYRYTGDPLSCRMSLLKNEAPIWLDPSTEEKRNRSPFDDFTTRLSIDKSDKSRLRKFFSRIRRGSGKSIETCTM